MKNSILFKKRNFVFNNNTPESGSYKEKEVCAIKNEKENKSLMKILIDWYNNKLVSINEETIDKCGLLKKDIKKTQITMIEAEIKKFEKQKGSPQFISKIDTRISLLKNKKKELENELTLMEKEKEENLLAKK